MSGLRSRREKLLLFISALVCLTGIALTGAALGTDHWIVADIRKASPGLVPLNSTAKHMGEIHFGLFHGHMVLEFGFGPRPAELWVVCDTSEAKCGLGREEGNSAFISQTLQDIKIEKSNASTTGAARLDSGLFSLELWVALLACCGLAMAWGLVGAGFALVNTFTKPIQTVTGPRGLYLWNVFAALCSVAGVVLFVALFFVNFNKNVMHSSERRELWNTCGLAAPGYSLYMLAASAPLYLANLLLVKCSGYQVRFKRSDEIYLPSRNGGAEMLY